MENALRLTYQACDETFGSYEFLKAYKNPFMFASHPVISAIGNRCEELGAGHISIKVGIKCGTN